MKYRILQAAGMLAVAPVTYGFLTWLNWWLPQVQR